MSVSNGPSPANNGLVFSYDMLNTQKSWKGQPATNTCNYDTYNWTDGNATVTRGATPPIAPPVSGYEISKIQSNNGADTSMNILYTSSVDQTNGGVYTHSAWILLTAGTYCRVGQHWNPWDAGTAQYIPLNVWTRVSYTLTNSAANYGQIANAYGTDGTIYVTGVQYEKGSTMTTFMGGAGTSRSTSQSIVDLTGLNTITATSLTYDSNGEFSFNGSGNYMDVSGAGFTSGMSAYTIMHWSRRDVESRMPVAGRTSTAFYQYGDNSWAYTHGGTWGEYYYPKSVSIPTGTWGFYCIVYNGSNVAIYRNGVLEGTQATTGTADWSQGMRIGYWTGGGSYAYSGKIGSVNFYNRALSASEVAQMFNNQRSRYGV
jgi:Concanavalin A-like lectin/glucanases superfamily